MDQRKWLASLKPGDKVAISTRNGYGIAAVESRNARGHGGTIVVGGRNIDGETGRERTGSDRAGAFYGVSIKPITDEIRRAIREARALRTVRAVEWDDVAPAVRALVARLVAGGEQAAEDVTMALQWSASTDLRVRDDAARLRALAGEP